MACAWMSCQFLVFKRKPKVSIDSFNQVLPCTGCKTDRHHKLNLINRNMVLFPSFTLHKVRLCTSFLDLYYFLQLFMWIGLYLGIKKWIGWGFFTTKKKKMRKTILVWKTLHKVCLKSVESFPRFSIISSILEQRNLQYSIELILVPIFSLRKLSWYKVNVLRVNAKLMYFVWLGH